MQVQVYIGGKASVFPLLYMEHYEIAAQHD